MTPLLPLIRPIERRPGRAWALPDGTSTSTGEVYAMFVAARAGDLGQVQALVAQTPGLATVEYSCGSVPRAPMSDLLHPRSADATLGRIS